jgi:hypothetical protein
MVSVLQDIAGMIMTMVRMEMVRVSLVNPAGVLTLQLIAQQMAVQ